MLQLFKSAETKRIKFLLNRYRELQNKDVSDEQAHIEIIKELKLKGLSLKEQLKTLDTKHQKRIIDERLSPFDISKSNLVDVISFIIKWEFPNKYSYMPSIEQIRSGKHPQAELEIKIDKIKKQFIK